MRFDTNTHITEDVALKKATTTPVDRKHPGFEAR